MALKNTDANEEYPYVFMMIQNIQQGVPDTASSHAIYPLSLLIKYYKIVDDKMIIDPDRQITIDVEDFTTLAITKMMQGDNIHINTLGAQQLSVKALLEEETGKTFEVI